MLIGLVATTLFVFWSLYKLRSVMDWTASEAVIEHSEVVHERLSDSYMYRNQLRYRYLFAGRSYQGQRIAYPFHNTQRELDSAQALHEQYPAGARVAVWVNPRKPEQASLMSLCSQRAFVVLVVMSVVVVSVLWLAAYLMGAL
ncbi:DUF3592 domain-containing protein [Aliagarivorans marinus]|uniref:DUF3592 domain-containing protein n=1 Tax=Aliagarivorans marinus TaxID=561965 RepID=UPI000411108C|nr:DUF3592 domain-containing protein [Aliagarivorans marinus]